MNYNCIPPSPLYIPIYILCLYLVPSKSDDVRVSVSVTLTVVSDILYQIELPTKIFGQRQPVVNSRSMGVHDNIINYYYIRIQRDLGSASRNARKSQNDIIYYHRYRT